MYIHTYTHINIYTSTFFSLQRSINGRRRRYRREIESFGWKFAATHMATRDICICIRVHLTHSWVCAHMLFSTYTYIYTPLSEIWYIRSLDICCISFQDFYLLASKYISTHQLLLFKAPSLSKYLNITLKISIYICHEYKMQKQYWYFFSLIAQHWFFEMLRHII